MFLRKILNSPDEPAPAPTSDESQTPSSPLGFDPDDSAPAKSTAPQESPNKSAEQKPKIPSISQDEIDALTEKASRYDLFINDPVLANKIADHYRAATGITAREPARMEQNDEPKEDPRMQALSQKLVQLELAQFHQQHPDLTEYRDDVAALISKYNMPLPEAYKFAKAAKAHTSQTQTKETPATPTSESGVSAGFDRDSDLDRAKVEKLINDPKATPRMDDAIDAALNYARKVAAQQND